MEFTRIKETCLYIKDIKATKHFYHDLLGLPFIGEKPGEYVMFRAGTSVLLCFIPEATKVQTNLPPHFGSGHLHFAFECPPEDYAAWKAKVEEAGIAIEHEQHWGREVYSFYFRDPDDHAVEIVMPGLWD